MDSPEDRAASALQGIRVLDLSGPMGNYAGKLFADLGADVVLVEPPGGSQLRHRPPFLDDRAGGERSLSFRVQQHEQARHHARLRQRRMIKRACVA